MCGVILAGERLREVGIALPERAAVAIGQTRVTDRVGAVIARDTAARQRIAVRVDDRLGSRTRLTDEIAALPGAAPGAARIPVPGFRVQLGVLPVGDGLPPGRQHTVDGLRREQLVGGAVWQAVYAGAERLLRPDDVGDVL